MKSVTTCTGKCDSCKHRETCNYLIVDGDLKSNEPEEEWLVYAGHVYPDCGFIPSISFPKRFVSENDANLFADRLRNESIHDMIVVKHRQTTFSVCKNLMKNKE